MAGRPAFKDAQRTVARAMAGALAATVIVLGIALRFGSAVPATPFADRLRFTLRTDILVAACLAAAVANVARLRFFSEPDIGGSAAGPGSPEIRSAGAILQNTFEQAVLAVLAHLAATASFEHAGIPVASAACLFIVGRIAFAAGYARGAGGRAFGFALTFYPSVIILAASAGRIALGWAGVITSGGGA